MDEDLYFFSDLHQGCRLLNTGPWIPAPISGLEPNPEPWFSQLMALILDPFWECGPWKKSLSMDTKLELRLYLLIKSTFISTCQVINWVGVAQGGLLQWLNSKESACNAGDAGGMGWIPGLGRSPGGGNGNPLQYSCWENLMDRGAWWATIHRIAENCTRLSTELLRDKYTPHVHNYNFSLPLQVKSLIIWTISY